MYIIYYNIIHATKGGRSEPDVHPHDCATEKMYIYYYEGF